MDLLQAIPRLTTPGRWVSLLGSRWDWNYSTEADEGLSGRSIQWPRGKVYGGSSAINAMAYERGDRACYDAWARQTDTSWSYDRLRPLFDAIERELAITATRDPHAGHLAFLDAAHHLGHSPELYRKTIRNGRRESAADAFLAPALTRPNLTMAPNTLVQRIVIERGRAIAVEIVRDGRREQIRAARDIVLSAGVIESPKLLMLSGVGPAGVLEAHGVPVVVDSPSVGENLHDHPRVSVRWKSLKPLTPSTTSAGLFVHAPRGGGASSLPTAVADLQFYVGRGIDAPDDFITLTVALSQPRSRGSVTLRSSDPSAPPLIKPNYFAEPADLDALVEGVRLAREIASSRAYDGLRGDAVDPAANVRTPEEVRGWIRRAAGTIYHPVGTCRMGRDNESVVDPHLRVRGVEGLRVADGSVMPMVVNSQTNAACLVIAANLDQFLRR